MAAIIPDVQSLQRSDYSGQQQVYRAPGITPVQGPNTASIIGGLLDEQYRKQATEELAKAKVQLQLGRIEQDNAYNEDQDVDTIEERWNGQMIEHLGKAATNISEGDVREAFVEESQVSLAQGQMAIKQFAFTKKADQQMAFASGSTDIIAKGAVQDGGDVVSSMEAITSVWEAAANSGYTSWENAGAQIRGAKFAIAEGKIKSLPPADQLLALKKPWAQELPNDIRVQLQNEAKRLLVLGEAQGAAYHGLVNDMSESEFDLYLYGNDKFTSDPQLLLAAQQQYTRLRMNKLKGQAEIGTNLYSKYDEMLRDKNGFDIEQFKNDFREDWKAITPAMRTNLERLEEEINNPTPLKVTNMDVYEKLMSKWDKGPDHRAEAKQYYFENSAKLNATDRKFWLKLVYGGSPESMFDWQKVVQDRVQGMSASQKGDVYSGINRWFLNFQDTHDGAIPDDQVINDQIHKSVTKYSTGILSSERVHSMDLGDRISAYDRLDNDTERSEFLSQVSVPEQREIQFGSLKQRDPEIYNDVLQSYLQVGVRMEHIKPAEFAKLFLALSQRRQQGEVQELDDHEDRIKDLQSRFQ